jgi:DNA invertase Pin-like site-specific DNA recombinase
LKEGEAKIVIIEKLDCLARDLMVQETILSDLMRQGFEVISVCEPDLCCTMQAQSSESAYVIDSAQKVHE